MATIRRKSSNTSSGGVLLWRAHPPKQQIRRRRRMVHKETPKVQNADRLLKVLSDRRRESEALTAKDIAHFAGFPRQYVSAYISTVRKRGWNVVSLKTSPPKYYLKGSGRKPRQKAVVEATKQNIVRILKNLPENDRKTVLRLVKEALK